MKKIVTIAALATGLAGAAGAATVTVGAGGYDNGYATQVSYNSDHVAVKRSTDRGDGQNALGASDGKFFEIGLLGEVIFTFGTTFVSPGVVTEVTFGNRSGWVEKANVHVRNAVSGVWTLVNEAPISNAQAVTSFTFDGGPFDAMKFSHFGSTNLAADRSFDIDSVRVAPVPLPAAGLMLLGAVGGLAALRRKRA